MRRDKRERNRLKRAGKRKNRLRAEGRVLPHGMGRQWRAVDAACDAEESMRVGDFESAVASAARAVSLAPGDPAIARLYVQAAEESGDRGHRRNSYDHVCKFIEPDASFLITLAGLHLEVRGYARAAALAERARRCFPARVKNRRRWLHSLEFIEQQCARAKEQAARKKTPAGSLSKAGDRNTPPPARARPDLGRRGRQEAASGYRAAAADLCNDGEAALPPREPARSPKTFPEARQSPNRSKTARAAKVPGVVTEEQPHPAALTIPVAIGPSIDGTDVFGRDARGTLDEVRLAVLAASIREAESFDRLLSVEQATDLTPLSYQHETARKVLSVFRGRALLADEVGLGKTVEAGLVLSEYRLRGRVRRALVLTPPSLVGQWREELLSKFGIEPVTTEDALFRANPTRFWREPGVTIASLATARNSRNHEAVAAEEWDLVIVDEAHTVKNARTKSYDLVSRLRSRFLLLLTATPIENNVEEIYNLVSLIRPGHLGGRGDFLRRFGKSKGRIGDRARREIRELLAEIMIRNTRALSGVKLPPRFARTVLVEPGEAEHELYGHLVGALRGLNGSGRARTLLSLLLQEAGSSPQAVQATLAKLRRDGGLPPGAAEALAPAIAFGTAADESAKGVALLRAIESAGGVTLTFTRFRATLDFLAALLERHGVPFERLEGSIPAASRHEAIQRCRRRGTGVLLSTDVGSEGLNLQFCHRIVNFDLPWSPMRIEQRIGRVHRIGQDHPVDVVNLCLAGSIEERILRILDERINLFEMVVGEVEMVLGYLDESAGFPDLMLDAFAERDESRREDSFERIAGALEKARTRYRNVKAYDEEFFRNELGV